MIASLLEGRCMDWVGCKDISGRDIFMKVEKRPEKTPSLGVYGPKPDSIEPFSKL